MVSVRETGPFFSGQTFDLLLPCKSSSKRFPQMVGGGGVRVGVHNRILSSIQKYKKNNESYLLPTWAFNRRSLGRI